MSDFLIGYLLHSTVLLSVVWLLMKVARPRSAVLAERLWKLAAVLPVLTSLAVACRPLSREADIATASAEAVSVESMVVENVTLAESEESLPDLTIAIEPNLTIETRELPGRRMVTPLLVEPSPVELFDEILIDEATGNPPLADHPPAEVVAPTVEIAAPHMLAKFFPLMAFDKIPYGFAKICGRTP